MVQHDEIWFNAHGRSRLPDTESIGRLLGSSVGGAIAWPRAMGTPRNVSSTVDLRKSMYITMVVSREFT